MKKSIFFTRRPAAPQLRAIFGCAPERSWRAAALQRSSPAPPGSPRAWCRPRSGGLENVIRKKWGNGGKKEENDGKYDRKYGDLSAKNMGRSGSYAW